MSQWLTHLKKFYVNKRKNDKSYSYKRAMKDAAKTYTKSNTTTKSIKKSKRSIRSRSSITHRHR